MKNCECCKLNQTSAKHRVELEKTLCQSCYHQELIEKKLPMGKLLRQRPYKNPMKYVEVIAFGEFGVQWRGQDIPKLDSPYPDDYTAVFGFTCTFCGASSINAEETKHAETCGRNSDANYLSFHNPRRN